MPQSMTGYARAHQVTDDFSLSVTMRSLNHRFLDVQLRIPPELEPFEARLRQVLKQRLRRGQIQLTALLRWNTALEGAKVNRALLDAYLKAYREIAAEHRLQAEPDLSHLLRVPGAIILDAGDLEESRRRVLEEALLECLSHTLDELVRVRQAEGAGIVEEMRQRAAHMRQQIESLAAARSDTIPKFQERLHKRLTQLLETAEIDPQRILQEAAILADRADISEELQRLEAHVERLRALLEGDSELGKPLDFLVQELNRETNTILSKTNSLGASGLPLTDLGLGLKGEVEKIREQAQNLE